MRFGPGVDQIFTHMKMSEVVEPLGERCEREPRTQEQEALDEAFVSRHGDSSKCLDCGGADAALYLGGRDLQSGVD